MVKHKLSVPLLTRFQCAHLLGVIFTLFNGWTNRHREVHDWTKVIGSQNGEPCSISWQSLFPVVYWVLKKDPWYNHLGQPLLFEMKTFRCKEINWLVQNQTQSLAQQCRSPSGQNEVFSCQNKVKKKKCYRITFTWEPIWVPKFMMIRFNEDLLKENQIGGCPLAVGIWSEDLAGLACKCHP